MTPSVEDAIERAFIKGADVAVFIANQRQNPQPPTEGQLDELADLLVLIREAVATLERPAEKEIVPREPTIEMLIAGRKQTFADMTGEHMGPSAENTWKAMYDAALEAARKQL